MITQAQRDAYRYALEDKGVPPVIAFMAARYLDVDDPLKDWFDDLPFDGFWWTESREGWEFWNAVEKNLS